MEKMTEWVHPLTITGDAATEERYLRRNHINEYFWREVKKGNHLLFVAPRRVGKTSIMQDLADNCPEGYAGIYQNIEGVKSKDDFYQRLFDLILQCIKRSKLREAKEWIADFFSKHPIEEISSSGIKLASGEVDYERRLRQLIPELEKSEIRAVIFLDEFAEVIHRLSRTGHQQDAIDILHLLREMRGNEAFGYVTLVYGGSIGLEFVIKSIDRLKLINDLHRIKIGPLSTEEAIRLIRQLTARATIWFTPETIDHLLETIHYLLPYYLQLMLEEINLVAYERSNPFVSIEAIDAAYQRVLSKRANFEDWLERLKTYQKDHFLFINAILINASHYGGIKVREIYQLAIDPKYNKAEDYMDFVWQLIDDGYLAETTEQTYVFVSPLLKKFWQRKFPVIA